MAGDYPGCGAELRSGGRACQCVISRAGLGGKWHCDGRHRPGWGDLCVSVSSIPAPQLSSSHFNWSFITGSITLSGHNTTDGDTASMSSPSPAATHQLYQLLLLNNTLKVYHVAVHGFIPLQSCVIICLYDINQGMQGCNMF